MAIISLHMLFYSGKARQQKMLAPKRVDTEKMWKDVARSLDDIDTYQKA